MRTPTLKQQTARGIKWLVGASFFQKALSFGTMVILARILNPSIFGLFALAFIAIDGLGLFKSMGFDSALIQRRHDVEKAANTAFFIIPLLGILLFLILNFSAPYIGRFLNNQDVIPIMRVLGLFFVFGCLRKVPASLLQKDMRFAKVAFSQSIGAIGYSAVSIILALMGFGVWSLVFGYLTKNILMMALVWHFAKWRPKWQFDGKIAIQMFKFGKFIFLTGILLFLRMNLANILVGKSLGVAALGIYALAFNAGNFIPTYLGGKVSSVLFPAYTKINDDIVNAKKAFLKVTKHIAGVAVPFTIGIYLISPEFVKVVYGEKWIGVIPLLKILVWVGLFRSFSTGAGPLFMAFKKAHYSFWLSMFQVSLFLIFAIPVATRFGLTGIALVVLTLSFIAFLIILALTRKLISINIYELYRAVRPSLITGLMMGISIFAIKMFFASFDLIRYQTVNFIFLICFSVLLYIVTLLYVDRNYLKEVKTLLFT